MGWTLQDFYNNEKNSAGRKEVMIEMNGEKKPVLISKVLISQSDKYTDVRNDKGTVDYFAEVLIDHVFHAETGEPLFNKVDILAESGYSSVAKFVDEKLPPGFVLDIQTAINEFSGIKPRQERIEDLKN